MQWEDRALVLSIRRHGERNVILEVITAAHGRHLGMVRGGISQRQAPFLQPGNTLSLTWRARLDEHLGHFAAEPVVNRVAHLLGDPQALNALGHIAFLIRLLPEREAHPEIFEAAEGLCSLFGHNAWLAVNLVRFELMILRALGFGLDLGRCAATGEAEDLAYVSPRSGRAVSAAAGQPWHDRLLVLPAFLLENAGMQDEAPEITMIQAGFRLSGYFLERHVVEPRGLAISQTRIAFITKLQN